MSSVSFSELRKNLATHFDTVEQDRTELVVTRQRHTDLVVMPLAELESLRATLHLLSTSINADRLIRSITQLDAGRGVERELVERELVEP